MARHIGQHGTDCRICVKVNRDFAESWKAEHPETTITDDDGITRLTLAGAEKLLGDLPVDYCPNCGNCGGRGGKCRRIENDWKPTGDGGMRSGKLTLRIAPNQSGVGRVTS